MRMLAGAASKWVAIGLVLLAGAGRGGSSAGAATLRWKFRAGETLHYVMEQKTVTAVKAAQQDVKTTLSQTIDMDWAVKEVAADGNAELSQTITRVRTKIESAFGTFEFDSKDPKEPQGPIAAGIVPLLKALVGASFSFKMNPQGELSDVRVPESVIKALREAGPAGGGGAGMFSEDGLKNMIRESSLSLPKEDLAPSKSWTKTTKVPSPPIGTMMLEKTYTYNGPDPKAGKDVERIALATKIDLQTDPTLKVDLKIKSQEGKGSFLFDNAAGRVASSAVNERIETIVVLTNNDAKTEITQSNDTTTTMKLVPAETSK